MPDSLFQPVPKDDADDAERPLRVGVRIAIAEDDVEGDDQNKQTNDQSPEDIPILGRERHVAFTSRQTIPSRLRLFLVSEFRTSALILYLLRAAQLPTAPGT